MVLHTFNPIPQVEFCELEASLVYLVSSRISRLHRPCLEKKKKKKKQNKKERKKEKCVHDNFMV